MIDYDLCLYVVGRGLKPSRALTNLHRICDAELAGRYRIEVVDVLADPEAGERANIIVSPTLVRRAPLPIVRIFGDLSDREAIRHGLGLGADEPREESQ